jgi:hypothetical protein
MKRSTPVDPRAEIRLADESPVTIRDVALPARGGAGPTLRDLLRAAAAGVLAPARAFMHGKAPDDA